LAEGVHVVSLNALGFASKSPSKKIAFDGRAELSHSGCGEPVVVSDARIASHLNLSHLGITLEAPAVVADQRFVVQLDLIDRCIPSSVPGEKVVALGAPSEPAHFT